MTTMSESAIWTIGHSNRPIGDLVDRLAECRISAVSDVRTVPRSRFAAQYDADALRQTLRDAQIAYVPMGVMLGGRPSAADLYDQDGHVSYARMAETAVVQAGIARLMNGVEQGHRVAVLCSEEDPAGCHRRLLLAWLLDGAGAVVWHIRGDGRVQDEAALRSDVEMRQPAVRRRLDAALADRRSVRPIRGPG